MQADTYMDIHRNKTAFELPLPFNSLLIILPVSPSLPTSTGPWVRRK